MVISTDEKKAFDQIVHSFITQILSKVEKEREFSHHDKGTVENSHTVRLKSERLKVFPLRSV